MKPNQQYHPAATQVTYLDPDGNEQQGWYENGHVYQDEALTVPLAPGSRYTAADGRVFEMTDSGGALVYAPYEVDEHGNWVKEGNAWYRRLRELWDTLNERPAFSADLNADALYRQYAALYRRQGSRAVEDAVGKLAGLTGGYSSSYAQSAGQLAYSTYLDKLAAAAEKVYGKAQSAYGRQTDALYDEIRAASKQYEADYSRYAKAHRSAQTDAYRTAMKLLQTGQLPSDETLALAGIPRADAEALARYYGARHG